MFTGEGSSYRGVARLRALLFFSYPGYTGKVIKAEVKAGETRKISQEGRVYF